MSRRLATLEDVADEARVSVQTVSRVLNKPYLVTERTRIKVMNAMAQLNYVPNRSAQLLAGKALPTLGLITTSLSLHAPSQIAASVKSHAEEQGFQVVISMLKVLHISAIQTVLNEFRAQKISCVIMSLPVEKNDAESLIASNPDMQCLFLDVPPDARVNHLGFDHSDGSTRSVEYLWSLGHRKFALLAGPESAISSRLRLACWRDALRRQGAENSPTEYGDWSAGSGWVKTFELFRRAPDITAILVANDQMALGVLSALHQLSRRVPQDISVTGYDDTPDSQYFQPALTTVAQDFNLLGKRAIKHIDSLSRGPDEHINELLPTSLVVRQSTDECRERSLHNLRIEQLKEWVQQL